MRVLRQVRGLSLRQLESRLAAAGSKLPFSALSNIETGKRGVDIDEVFALAKALHVGVGALIFPAGDAWGVQVEVMREDGSTTVIETSLTQIRKHHIGRWPLWVTEPPSTADDLWELADYERCMNPDDRAREAKHGGHSGAEIGTLGNLVYHELLHRERLLKIAKEDFELLSIQLRAKKVDVSEAAARARVATLWFTLRDQIMLMASGIRSSGNRFFGQADRDRAAKIETQALDLIVGLASMCSIRTDEGPSGEHKFPDGQSLTSALPVGWPETETANYGLPSAQGIFAELAEIRRLRLEAKKAALKTEQQRALAN